MPGKTDPFDNLIFEVNCLGCGHVAFSLPYREGTHHTMTCHRCGEVTIAHVLDGGHVAVATFEQRAAALERVKSEVEGELMASEVMAEERVRGYYGEYGSREDYTRDVTLPHRRTERGPEFVRLIAMSDSVPIVSSYDNRSVETSPGVLEVSLQVYVQPEGLQLRVLRSPFESRAIWEDGSTRDLSSMKVLNVLARLLVEPRVDVLNGSTLVEPIARGPSSKARAR